MTNSRPRAMATGMRSRHIGSRPKVDKEIAARRAAKRKQRQRVVMRNRIMLGVGCIAALALVVFLLSKLIGLIAGFSKTIDTTTLTFKSEGDVVFEEVVDFDSNVYSKSELKNYTKDLISAYNDKNGSKSIVLNKLKTRGGKAYVKSTYQNAKVYSDFTTYDTYDGTYEKAIKAGYKFTDVFATVKEGQKKDVDTVDDKTAFAGKRVAVVNENCTVVVPGTIEYVSDSSTELIDSNTVRIAPADGNEDATETVYIIYK